MEQDRPFNAHADPIANALDISPNTAPLSLHSSKDVPANVPATGTEATEKDVEYARENLYHLAERGRDALDGILDLANQSQHPRAYEVVGQLIKTLTDTNEKIVDIQAKAKDILSDPKKAGPDKVTNNLFVGTNADLTKLLGGNARSQLLDEPKK
tara:strand:- start:1234 stop:1698 length:465 start_codon:yes stop_codon:yes gene_type:complete